MNWPVSDSGTVGKARAIGAAGSRGGIDMVHRVRMRGTADSTGCRRAKYLPGPFLGLPDRRNRDGRLRREATVTPYVSLAG
jgi:hypothetical protein